MSKKPYNAADKDSVDEADQAQQRAAQQEKDDFEWLMNDIRGRRFMWRLLSVSGVFTTSFTGNSTTFFNEGQRNIGLMYTNQSMEVCPEQYLQMIQEAKRKEITDG